MKKISTKDFFVEVQIRSKIQHAWATAVEIVDTFTNQALKSNNGSKEWIEFFRCTSAEFASLEDRPIGRHVKNTNTKLRAQQLEKELNVIARLKAFIVTTDRIAKDKINKSDYYLLELTSEPSQNESFIKRLLKFPFTQHTTPKINIS